MGYSSTQKRARVDELCKGNHLQKAVKMAESIEDGWFKTQAYAKIAMAASQSECKTYLVRAIKASESCEDLYKGIGSGAWALRACLERGEKQLAAGYCQSMLRKLPQIPEAGSRAEASFHLWQAVLPFNGRLLKSVEEDMVSTCSASGGWRGALVLSRAVLILAASDRDGASKMAERMPECRYKRQAQRRLAAGKTDRLLKFF